MRKYEYLSNDELLKLYETRNKQIELASLNTKQLGNQLRFDVCFIKAEMIRRNLAWFKPSGQELPNKKALTS